MGSRGAFQDVDTGKFNFVENGQNYHTVGDVDGVQVILQNMYIYSSVLIFDVTIYSFFGFLFLFTYEKFGNKSFNNSAVSAALSSSFMF